jgi:hypothetical protein
MKRERVLKIVLVVLGLLFCAAVYPLILMAKQDPALAMMTAFGCMGYAAFARQPVAELPKVRGR